MLSMMNAEQPTKPSPTSSITDSDHVYQPRFTATAPATAAARAAQVPTGPALTLPSIATIEPPRAIPVSVLVKHEEYSAAAASTATLAMVAAAAAEYGNHSNNASTEARLDSSTLRGGNGSVATSDAKQQRQPREKRSTKSKCPPGLRSGKWTPEEEAFTNMIIYFFKLGRLNIEDGTSLRWYLAKRLNCEAMRVTKKLKGNSSIGKQIFRALEDTEENRQLIEHAARELAILEQAFMESLTATGQVSHGGHPNATTPAAAAAAAAAASRAKKQSPHRPLSAPRPPNLEAKKLVVQKVRSALPNSEDAKLLLHFFVEAQDAIEMLGVEKKRLFSDIDTSPATSAASSGSESPPGKRRAVANTGSVVDAA